VAFWASTGARIAGREDTAKVFVEADAGFLGGSVGVGSDGPEKIPDLLLNLILVNLALLRARGNGLAWLELVVHSRLHSCLSPENLSSSFQGSRDP